MPVDEDLLSPRKAPAWRLPLVVAAVALLLLGAFWLGRSSAPRAPARPEVASTGGTGGAEAPGEGGTGGAPAALAEARPPPPPTAVVAPPTPPPPQSPEPAGDALLVVRVRVDGPLEPALIATAGPEVGPALAQVTTRLLVWWLDVTRDLRKGDELAIVYSLPPGKEPTLHALRFTSGKLGGERRAYRHHVPGAPWAKLFDADGKEIEQRLVDTPIDVYEQITSLLRDGRKHKGVDFKAPSGTPVVAPFDGTITRKNWSFRGNGNCLEMNGPGGLTAMFLHLEGVEAGINPGTRVKKGQVVARSGNTGRSTAPHLHYQLMRGGKVLDPFDVQPWTRLGLSTAELPAFQGTRADLDRRMDEAR